MEQNYEMENDIFSNNPFSNIEIGSKGIIISHESLGPDTHRFDSFEEATEAVNSALDAMGEKHVYIYPDVYGNVWARDIDNGAEPVKIGHGE